MKNILDNIYEHKLIEVRNRKKIISLTEICAKIKCCNKPHDFFLTLKNKSDKSETALICEIKRGSPSAGLIRQNFDIIEIAKSYQRAGASCLSVLTDEKFFLSNNNFLEKARSVVDIPILRKDFIVDAYQVYEARMLGADCILLIVAMLDDYKLQELEKIALELGLSVLIEVHNQEELRRALKLKSRLIGINNRNLKTLEVNLQNSLDLVNQVPKDYVLVAESGIKSLTDIKILKQFGINCFLIGEYFMRQENIENAVKSMLL